MRSYRQAEHLIRHAFSQRKSALLPTRLRIRLLAVRRDGVMNLRANAGLTQLLLQSVTLRMLYYVQMPRGFGPLGHKWQS